MKPALTSSTLRTSSTRRAALASWLLLALAIAGASPAGAQDVNVAGRGTSSTLQPQGLPESAWETIEAINVRGADLRDVLRAIAERHELNLVVEGAIQEQVTTRLSDVTAADAIAFLCEEYGLTLEQTGSILRVSRLAPVPTEPKIQVEGGALSVDAQAVQLDRFLRRLSAVSEVNVVAEGGARGPVSGFLDAAPFESGLRALLRQNGFALEGQESLFTVRPARQDGQQRPLSSAQVTIEEGLVDLEVREAEVARLLEEVARRLDLQVVTYQKPEGRISASVSDLTPEATFNYLLKGSGVTFRKEGAVYVVGGKDASGIASSKLVRLEHLKAETMVALLPETLSQQAKISLVKEQNGFVVTGPSDVIYEVEDFAREVDQPTPQIMIEALVVDFRTDDLYELGFRFGRQEGEAEGEVSSEGRSSYSFDEDGYRLDANGTRVNQYVDAIAKALGGLGEGLSNIGELPPEFYLQLRALAQEGVANIRSKPKISTLNGHPASISVGTTQYFILRTTDAVPGQGSYVPVESERFEKVEANVTLDIVPWVTASGEVTVEIRPEFSAPVGAFSPEVPPTINTRVVESTVRLRDGETIILGGLIQESRVTRYNEVPILGQIPLLGQLFRSRQHDLQKSELVIYLTPHVFYGGEGEGEKWEQLPGELGLSNEELGLFNEEGEISDSDRSSSEELPEDMGRSDKEK